MWSLHVLTQHPDWVSLCTEVVSMSLSFMFLSYKKYEISLTSATELIRVNVFHFTDLLFTVE